MPPTGAATAVALTREIRDGRGDIELPIRHECQESPESELNRDTAALGFRRRKGVEGGATQAIASVLSRTSAVRMADGSPAAEWHPQLLAIPRALAPNQTRTLPVPHRQWGMG